MIILLATGVALSRPQFDQLSDLLAFRGRPE